MTEPKTIHSIGQLTGRSWDQYQEILKSSEYRLDFLLPKQKVVLDPCFEVQSDQYAYGHNQPWAAFDTKTDTTSSAIFERFAAKKHFEIPYRDKIAGPTTTIDDEDSVFALIDGLKEWVNMRDDICNRAIQYAVG